MTISGIASAARANGAAISANRGDYALPETGGLSGLDARNLAAALNHISQGVCLFDASSDIVLCNQAYLKMYSLSSEVVKPGCSLRRLIEHRKEVGLFFGDVDEYVAMILNDIRNGAIKNRVRTTADGRVINVVDHPIAGGGWVVTHEDISERWRAEQRVAYLAHHDAMTGLVNRARLVESIEYQFALARRSSEEFAIFLVDLDHFKHVNDTLGHPVGDTLLREVAARLKKATRESDTVARLGGDEFVIVQSIDCRPVNSVISLAERIQREFAEPYSIDGHQIGMNASIGIALAPRDVNDAAGLLKNADIALYRAKAGGGGTYRMFDIAMDLEARARNALEVDLRNAVARNEFEVYYQTVADFENGEVCGVEALIRWHHPERGMVPPGEFVPLAEETGLIVPIGEWVLRTACLQAAKWPKSVKLAVNLSPVQFKRGDLVEVVAAVLAASGLPPQRLELEITETVSLQRNAHNLEQLVGIKKLGVTIALDDFGTGFSSLSYLRSFPFDVIKIDRSFVAEMSSRKDCAAIVNAVIALGKSLGVETTAEGVETPEQFELLRTAGCVLAQGYMISKPLPAAEMDFSSAWQSSRKIA
jgi:diguanylate cyclase (GGDEF)-like protein